MEVNLEALLLILVLGVGGNWLASKMRVPGVLVLLTLGCIFGGILHLVNPDKLLGNALQPLVALAVGFILFEGGMTLKLSELRPMWRSIVGLLTIGVLITWVLAALAAYYFLAIPTSASLVLGAILTVTGPTVIGPLLREIRPRGNAGVVAKWEGIVVDPVGATLAVLVFEATESIKEARFESAIVDGLFGFGATALAGVVIGLLFGWTLIESLRRYWIPDHLRNPVVVMFVAAGFVIADWLHHEAGLVSVTLMGVMLANQKHVDSHTILEFKETITTLLISVLFIMLSARIELGDIAGLSWRGLLFVLAIILVVRPAAVLVSTIGSRLTWRERMFLSWFAPRGIVAAAVASLFAARMGPEGELIAPAVFMVILATVATYGLSASWVAGRLGLAEANPQGILIAGANPVARAIAIALNAAGFRTHLVDNRYDYVSAGRNKGLTVTMANILADYVVEELDLGGTGKFLGMTPNDEVNTLAANRFRSIFGAQNVYQLPVRDDGRQRLQSHSIHRMRGRVLFSDGSNFDELLNRLESGWTIHQTKLTTAFSITDLLSQVPLAYILFVIDRENKLQIRRDQVSNSTISNAASIIYLAPSGQALAER